MSVSSTESPLDSVLLATEREEGDVVQEGDDENAPSAWAALFSCGGLKYVVISFGLAMSQQLTGINAIMFYGPLIFESAGVPASSLLLVTMGAIGGWNLISVFISFALVDRLGRRPLMLGALAAMFVATLVSGIAYSVDSISKTVESVVLIGMTMIFIGGFESGPGPLFFVMASESFSEHIKSEGLVLCNMFAWTFNIMLVFTFPLLNESVGPGVTQFILAGICLLAWGLVFFRVPETKAVNKEAAKDADAASEGELGDEIKVEVPMGKRVCACFMVAVLAGGLYGYQTCVVSGLTKPLMNDTASPYDLTFEVDSSTNQTAAIYTSIFTTEILVGGMVGSFVGTPIADKWGRKVGIIVCAAFGLIPSITLSVFPIYWVAVASRTIQGIAVGMSCVVAPMYVNEMAPVARRGSLGTLFQVSICTSILLAQLLNFLLQPDSTTERFEYSWYWKVQFAGGAVFAGLLLIYGIFLMPESTTWQDKQRMLKRRKNSRSSRFPSSTSNTAPLLDDDEFGEVNPETGESIPKVPSLADMLETPKGMEWKTTTSFEDVRKAAGGMASAIKKSFENLKGLDSKEGT